MCAWWWAPFGRVLSITSGGVSPLHREDTILLGAATGLTVTALRVDGEWIEIPFVRWSTVSQTGMEGRGKEAKENELKPLSNTRE